MNLGRKIRKDEVTKRRINRDFPHQVAVWIAAADRVARFMTLRRFCTAHAMPYKTRADLRREPPADFVRFCYADPAHADAFLAEFGGERITIEPNEITTLTRAVVWLRTGPRFPYALRSHVMQRRATCRRGGEPFEAPSKRNRS